MNPYDDLIMDHIRNARNYRVLDDFDRRANGTNPLCGDEMVVYLKLDGECIADISFQCTCCGISMASASVMTDIVKGETIGDASRILGDFAAALSNPGESAAQPPSPEKAALLDTVRRFPARARCALLPWTTLEGALNGQRDVVVAS